VLCECYAAIRLNLPIVTVRVSGKGYDYEEARSLLSDLPRNLEERSPGAVAELESLLRPLGADVHDVQRALEDTLPNLISTEFDPSAGDNQVHASILDMVERLKQQLLRARAESSNNLPRIRITNNRSVRSRHAAFDISTLRALGRRQGSDGTDDTATGDTGTGAGGYRNGNAPISPACALRRSASTSGYEAVPSREQALEATAYYSSASQASSRSSSVPCRRTSDTSSQSSRKTGRQVTMSAYV